MIATFSSACPACHNRIVAGSRIVRGSMGRFVHPVCPSSTPVPAWSAIGIDPRPDADDRAAAEWARHTAPPARRLGAADIGVWITTDTVLYLVAHVRGYKDEPDRVYARRFRPFSGTRLTESGATVKGEWDYGESGFSRELVGLIVSGNAVLVTTPEQATMLANVYGICGHCGRFLKDATSVAAALGPVCAARLGIDRKAMIAARRAPVKSTRTYAEIFGDETVAPEPEYAF